MIGTSMAVCVCVCVREATANGAANALHREVGDAASAYENRLPVNGSLLAVAGANYGIVGSFRVRLASENQPPRVSVSEIAGTSPNRKKLKA